MKWCYPLPPESSRGIWLGDSPTDGSAALLMIQISIIVLISYTLRFLLRPLQQPIIVSQILTGIIIGPSFLGKYELFSRTIFSRNKQHNLKVVGHVGHTFYSLMMGLKTDVGQLTKTGKKAVVIGLAAMWLPYCLLFPFQLFVIKDSGAGNKPNNFQSTDHPFFPDEMRSIYYFASYVNFLSATSVIVVFAVLSELNLSNSKLGRLGVACAMTQMIFESIKRVFSNTQFNIQLANSISNAWGSALSFWIVMAFIIFGSRPVGAWIVKKTPKGRPLSDLNFIVVIGLAVAGGFLLSAIGHSLNSGVFYVGLVLPTGPPLGSTFVDRLEGLVSILFFPVFVAVVGLETDFSAIFAILAEWRGLLVINLCVCAIMAGVVVLTALYSGLSLHEAITLSLIMSVRGIGEIAVLHSWIDAEIGDARMYTVQVLTILLLAGATKPLLVMTYNPSRRFRVYRRCTVQNSKDQGELRLLACVHNVESVPTTINLLEAMYTSVSPLCTYVLHHMQLIGRVDTVLVPYEMGKRNLHATADTERICNAFHTFETRHLPSVVVRPYIAISPYRSMYEDICSMAMDMKVSMIILPFHVTEVEGTVESDNQSLRSVNLDVLAYAPCSAAILIDHGKIKDIDMALSSLIHNVAIYFFGGPDDREALAVGMRLASNDRICATLVRFIPGESQKDIRDRYEEKLDEDIIHDFKAESVHNQSLVYREELVQDGEEMTNVIVATCSAFDLLVVGKSTGSNSGLTQGMSTWSEYPELGVVGDLLASSDSAKNALTLVVQQQPSSRKEPDFA